MRDGRYGVPIDVLLNVVGADTNGSILSQPLSSLFVLSSLSVKQHFSASSLFVYLGNAYTRAEVSIASVW